jgi:hypothetical protein
VYQALLLPWGNWADLGAVNRGTFEKCRTNCPMLNASLKFLKLSTNYRQTSLAIICTHSALLILAFTCSTKTVGRCERKQTSILRGGKMGFPDVGFNPTFMTILLWSSHVTVCARCSAFNLCEGKACVAGLKLFHEYVAARMGYFAGAQARRSHSMTTVSTKQICNRQLLIAILQCADHVLECDKCARFDFCDDLQPCPQGAQIFKMLHTIMLASAQLPPDQLSPSREPLSA